VLSEVVGDLLIHISHQTDKKLLREKLRSTPVDVKIDAVLVLRVLVLEIVGKSRDGREFVARCRIEVGVATAAVDRGVANAEIGETRRIVGADGNVSRHIGHEVVDACVPLPPCCLKITRKFPTKRSTGDASEASIIFTR